MAQQSYNGLRPRATTASQHLHRTFEASPHPSPSPVLSSPQSSLHSPWPRHPLAAAPSPFLPSPPAGSAPHSGVRAGGAASATYAQ